MTSVRKGRRRQKRKVLSRDCSAQGDSRSGSARLLVHSSEWFVSFEDIEANPGPRSEDLESLELFKKAAECRQKLSGGI